MTNDRVGFGESIEIQVIDGYTGKEKAHIYKSASVNIDLLECWRKVSNGEYFK